MISCKFLNTFLRLIVVLFLDIEPVFNNITSNPITETLRRRGVVSKLLQLIKANLKRRKFIHTCSSYYHWHEDGRSTASGMNLKAAVSYSSGWPNLEICQERFSLPIVSVLLNYKFQNPSTKGQKRPPG